MPSCNRVQSAASHQNTIGIRDLGCHTLDMSEPNPRGRQPDASSKSGQIRTLLATGMKAGEISKKLGCTAALVYNVKARMVSGAPTRGPGRPPKAAASAAPSMDGLSSILSAVQNAERERAKLRAALEKIQTVLRDVMA